jgi:hypothetical protein
MLTFPNAVISFWGFAAFDACVHGSFMTVIIEIGWYFEHTWQCSNCNLTINLPHSFVCGLYAWKFKYGSKSGCQYASGLIML